MEKPKKLYQSRKHLARVAEILGKIHYKTWKFFLDDVYAIRAEGTQNNFFEITGTFETSDVDGSNYVLLRGATELLPENATEPMIIEAVFSLITRLEDHEREEFFLYEGKRIFDPHKKPK